MIIGANKAVIDYLEKFEKPICIFLREAVKLCLLYFLFFDTLKSTWDREKVGEWNDP